MTNNNFDVLKTIQEIQDLEKNNTLSPEEKLRRIQSYMIMISENVPRAKEIFSSKINDINELILKLKK